MRYRKIRASFYKAKKRFYRSLYVKEDIDLYTLGIILGLSLGAEFEHEFLFNDHNIDYVPQVFLDTNDCDNWVSYMEYKLDDLPNKFKYIYDAGDNWEFDIIVSEKVEELELREKYDGEIDEEEEEPLCYLISGKGQGIWEDNIATLFALFEGELDPTDNTPNEELGYYLPWNYHINQFGDFDLPIDIEELNELILSQIDLVKEFMEDKHSDTI